jgi:calmodulin
VTGSFQVGQGTETKDPSHTSIHLVNEKVGNRFKMSEGEWSDMFKIMDESDTGTIPNAKFGECVRAAGQYPTEAQIKEMLRKADPSNKGLVTISAFLEQMKWINRKNPLDLDEIGGSFKMFDKDGIGMISKSELQHILTSMGERLTSEEAEEFVKEARLDKHGNLNYMDFLRSVTEM